MNTFLPTAKTESVGSISDTITLLEGIHEKKTGAEPGTDPHVDMNSPHMMILINKAESPAAGQNKKGSQSLKTAAIVGSFSVVTAAVSAIGDSDQAP